MAQKHAAAARIEYHVIHTGEPEGRWEIHYGKDRLGYENWNKESAVDAATNMARTHTPSAVVIHDRGGAIERTLPFDHAGKSTL